MRAQEPSNVQVESYIANLEMALRAAQGGNISFNRAVLTFQPHIKNDIFLNTARAGTLDVYGFFSYAISGLPRTLNQQERQRIDSLMQQITPLISGRLSGVGESALARELEELSARSPRFASLAIEDQAGEISSIIEINRGVQSGTDTQRMEKMRRFLTSRELGVAGSEWARSVTDIIFDRDGRIAREVEKSADGNKWSVVALRSYIGFSDEERNEIRSWLERGTPLNARCYNRVIDLITGEVRGEARAILVRLGLDFGLRTAQAASDQDMQNVYDTNRHLQIFQQTLDGRST
jgi:hypothetical protein